MMLSQLKETYHRLLTNKSPGKFIYTRKQIGMVSKNLCKASVMKFVTAHLFLIPSYIFDTRDVTVDNTLKFVNTKARAVNQTN